MRSIGKPAATFIGGLILLLLGIFLGGHPQALPGPVRSALVSDDRGDRAEVQELIKDNFYKKVSDKKLEQNSLQGMVDGLDDQFSHYISPSQTKHFNQALNGQFEGVGMGIEEDKRGLRVVKVYDGSPARKAGIQQGEFVTRVNGKSIAGLSSDVAAARISGKAGTKVRLQIVDAKTKRTRDLNVNRARINPPVVTGKVARRNGKRYGVVTLATFNEGAHAKVRREVDRLLDEDVEGIVFDLRGNGGGLLSEGVLVASVFVESGLIVYTKGRTKPRRDFDARGDAIDSRVPVVVLVDGGTASASEIVTGALRDHDRATVVGTKTFGKGVFQEVKELSNGGVLDITVGQYFVPSGQNLGHKGIVPPVKARDNQDTPKDEALPKALKALADRAAGR